MELHPVLGLSELRPGILRQAHGRCGEVEKVHSAYKGRSGLLDPVQANNLLDAPSILCTPFKKEGVTCPLAGEFGGTDTLEPRLLLELTFSSNSSLTSRNCLT